MFSLRKRFRRQKNQKKLRKQKMLRKFSNSSPNKQKVMLRRNKNMPKKKSSLSLKLKKLLRNSLKLLYWLKLNRKKLKLNNLKLSLSFRMLLVLQLKLSRPLNPHQKRKSLSQLFLKKLKAVP